MTDKVRAARKEAWEMGVVAPWYLRPSQLEVYNLLRREKDPFIEKARRWGGTTAILAYCIEQLRIHPRWVVRWCEPWKNQAREIVMPEIDKIQADCPPALKFKFQSIDSVYVHPNGSRIFLRGVNEDRGESARGPFANIIVADEYGSWKHASYIINEILIPQLLKQECAQLIKNSSPPEDLGHVYYLEKEQAQREGRLIQKTIYDNESLSPEEIEAECRRVGGPESPAWRREYLLEPVSDPKKLIVPEWSDELNTVPDDYPRPEFYSPYVGGDSGADDNTAVLFGYHDFLKNEVVIEEELVIGGQTTKDIVDQAKTIEKILWGTSKDKEGRPLQPRKRVYDAPKQLIFDIFTEHKWPVSMPQKDDKHAAIHEFRLDVGKRRFKVKERCKQLRHQLKVGMWRDEKHQDFERSEGLGHLDAIAAAIYFNRSVDIHHNPWPLNPGVSRYTHFIPPATASSQGKTEQALKKVFGSRGRLSR